MIEQPYIRPSMDIFGKGKDDENKKKVILSGVQPSGRPHIGNYFGAMKQFVELQNANDSSEKFFMIADYHALNTIQDGETLRKNIIDLAIDYLAIGLRPENSIIFKQSDVSAHPELTWIFDTITPIPYLMLAHAFKAKLNRERMRDIDVEKEFNEPIDPNENQSESYDSLVKRLYSRINVGTFNYPMLMASDILLYSPDYVPVGQDQKQHIEYTRDTAKKFNHIFGKTFELPEPLIFKDLGVVPGTDGQKMSKSYGNTISLFASYSEIQKAVMSIVTDSNGGVPENVYNIHILFTEDKTKLHEFYLENRGNNKLLKEKLIEDIEKFIKPLREKREEIAKDIPRILKILKEGAERAKKVADSKLEEVKKKIGVSLN